MPEKARILYAEDDRNLAFVTADNLGMRGYEVTWVSDGEAALQKFRNHSFDVCVLDVMMPGIDGFVLARRIREQDEEVPILFLTARSLVEDKIQGLSLGADDYICKPYSLDELCLRIEVFLKRRTKTSTDTDFPDEIRIAGFSYLPKDQVLQSTDAERYTLTKKENEVLKLLAMSPNRLVKKEEILKKIWGSADYFSGRSLDVYIAKLRKYLKADPAVQIENVHHVGFVLRY